MRYLLDTSAIIDLLRQKVPATHFIRDHMKDEVMTSCICEMEIITGVYLSRKGDIKSRKKQIEDVFSSFYEVIPFDSRQAGISGQIKADLTQNGNLIDDLDILISSSALATNSILVTANPKHFTRIKNLSVYSLL